MGKMKTPAAGNGGEAYRGPDWAPDEDSLGELSGEVGMTTNLNPFYGLPAAATVTQSITLAQLLILRRLEAKRQGKSSPAEPS
jgi:hypothetical protein